MWDKLKIRLLSAVVLIAILLAVVLFAADWVFSLIVCALTFMVMSELTKVLRLETKPAIVITNYIFAAGYMALTFWNLEVQHALHYLLTVLFIITLMTIAVLSNSKENNNI